MNNLNNYQGQQSIFKTYSVKKTLNKEDQIGAKEKKIGNIYSDIQSEADDALIEDDLYTDERNDLKEEVDHHSIQVNNRIFFSKENIKEKPQERMIRAASQLDRPRWKQNLDSGAPLLQVPSLPDYPPT